MIYTFAPMEGATTYCYRRAHHRYFSGVDKYYVPFISPTQDHLFTKRELRELLPEQNEGIPTVPQLLTKRAEDFIWAAGELEKMGYPEVNLNAGCPSSTVVTKGKGSGMLKDPAALNTFLDQVFSAGLNLNISVKTRLGLEDDEEFWDILEVYNRYPISQLTIHPRVKKDLYKGRARREVFAQAMERSKNPLCYNGDLVTAEQCLALEREMPGVEAVMLGRGLLADPALARKAAGGAGADKHAIGGFLDEVYSTYRRDFGSDRNAMLRMKEVWFYLIRLFEDSASYGKKLKKVADPRVYETLVADVLRDLELKEHLEEDCFDR